MSSDYTRLLLTIPLAGTLPGYLMALILKAPRSHYTASRTASSPGDTGIACRWE